MAKIETLKKNKFHLQLDPMILGCHQKKKKKEKKQWLKKIYPFKKVFVKQKIIIKNHLIMHLILFTRIYKMI